MRIVQLTDIHLSTENLSQLQNFYLEALIADLSEHNSKKKIDVILMTGDLVDKGGDSLGDDPYGLFKEYFIDPIRTALELDKSQFLFIPGNHDVQRQYIYEENEVFLTVRLDSKLANQKLQDQKNTLNDSNKRISIFKDFEKEFHKNTDMYVFSYNESLVIKEIDGQRVGFALINDSWRCSTALKKEHHFIGTNQLLNAKKYFNQNHTAINFAVFHHPLDSFNSHEAEEIENILQTYKFDVAYFGHSHKGKYESINSSNGGWTAITARSAFNHPEELEVKYQPGYTILDLDISSKQYTLNARKYIEFGKRFDKDVELFKGGQKVGQLNQVNYAPLNLDVQPTTDGLPSIYNADVHKIVKLLIGKSLYPDEYIFVRELIQNSVDACNRMSDKYHDFSPSIRVIINSSENSFEIIDEGDGMSKKVLREHFSIIGKSISQEFADSLNSGGVISQFGIGFISTFIVSKKIVVSTKTEEDGLINFEIENVFKGFLYTSDSSVLESQKSGTSIKVFLKRDFDVNVTIDQIRTYCRHVNNLVVYYNGFLQPNNNSWNTEGGVYQMIINTSGFECQLVISAQQRELIATNAGFLINKSSPQLLPFLFPSIIGGEVVFQPRAIDFDLSRTNIMDTEKALAFRRSISVSMRYLFRQVLENKTQDVYQSVVNYLQFFLVHFDAFQNQFNDSYIDFYSKNELIMLVSLNTFFQYRGNTASLSTILTILNSNSINKIYVYDSNQTSEKANIISDYIVKQGNLIVYTHTIRVQFRNVYYDFGSTQSISIIARDLGFELVDVHTQSNTILDAITLSKEQIPEEINNALSRIQVKHHIFVRVARFGANYTLVLNGDNFRMINFDHPTFRQLSQKLQSLSPELLDTYLLGVLNFDIS